MGDFLGLGDFFGLGDFLVDESGRMFTETINAPFAKDGNTSKSGTLYRRVICVLTVGKPNQFHSHGPNDLGKHPTTTTYLFETSTQDQFAKTKAQTAFQTDPHGHFCQDPLRHRTRQMLP